MSLVQLIIRQAIADDLEAIVRLLRRSWLVTWAPELPFEAVQAFAAHDPAKTHAETRWSHQIVAVAADELLGLFEVAEDRLEHLHVDPRAWDRGIGSWLLCEAESRIKQRHGVAHLEVRAFNERARRFYSNHGWIETRSYPGTECGSSVETIEMRKTL